MSTKAGERDEDRGLTEVVASVLDEKDCCGQKTAGPNSPESDEGAGSCCGRFQIGFGWLPQERDECRQDGSAERSRAGGGGNLTNLDLQFGPCVLNDGILQARSASVS
jgi:hypothetical protein